MTNFDDRFAGGGGAFLGVPYPRKSKTLSSGYNNTFTTGGGTIFPFIVGRDIPVPDTVYAGIIAPVANLGATSVIARGQRPDGTSIWSKAYGTALSGRATGSYYMDEASGKLYMLQADTGTTNLKFIDEIDMLLGTVVTKVSLVTGITSINADHSYHLRPVTPGSPGTSDWRIIHGFGSGQTAAMSVITTSNTITTDKQDLKVDSGGTNQSFGFKPQYMTADNKIIIGDWLHADAGAGLETAGTNIFFNIQRGPMQIGVIMPFDGNMPYPFASSSLISTTPIDMAPNALKTAWISSESSVIFIADSATTATGSAIQVFGKRVFDKVDFDRWLKGICDALNMPTGEAFF